MMSTHICYLCFSRNTTFVGRNSDFSSDIFICNNCGLIQNNFVSQGYLDDYYHSKYRATRKEGISPGYLKFMGDRGRSQYDFIIKNLPASTTLSSVLDIGASAGKLLEQFHPASKLFAVESDSSMIEHLINTGFIEVVNGDVLFDNENIEKFDLVTLSHVFEHINNPLNYLYKLYKIVAPGGYVFLEVPNEPLHLMRHYLLKKQKGIGHLFDYTVDTLNQMIHKSGLFTIEKITTFSIDVNDYIKGASIRNFEENQSGNGIHIRCLLKKNDKANIRHEHEYIDSILQNHYRNQIAQEERIEKSLSGLKSLRKTLDKIKILVKVK